MNFRYPEGITADEILNRIKPVAADHNFAISRTQGEVPHYVDADDPIVTTLLKAYVDQTGDQTAQAEVVGGGTYGRLDESRGSIWRLDRRIRQIRCTSQMNFSRLMI